jgi:cytidine deaminase
LAASAGPGKSIDEQMIGLLPAARRASHAALSNYHVGAVIRGASNKLYLGANIEVPGQMLGLAVHAEQAAVANAYMHGEDGVTALAVTAAPCGHCRQFLTEMVPDGSLRILFPGAAATTLAALLPMPFGPKNLGRNEGALPAHQTTLRLPKTASDPLVAAAFEAARRAYSPYTQSPSGVALFTSSGRTFPGSYIENVAFNPASRLCKRLWRDCLRRAKRRLGLYASFWRRSERLASVKRPAPRRLWHRWHPPRSLKSSSC